MPGCSSRRSRSSALSVAAQSLANVRRGPDLEGPISLSLLSVAESGERKTACDRHFADGLREWEAEQAEQVKPDLAKSRAKLAAWEAEREAVVLKIKQARKGGKPTDKAHDELEQLESDKPEAVRIPSATGIGNGGIVGVESRKARRLALWRHPFE